MKPAAASEEKENGKNKDEGGFFQSDHEPGFRIS